MLERKADKINEDFRIGGAKLCDNAALPSLLFEVDISERLVLEIGEENIIEMGAVCLPLQLSHGKDMRIGEPIYSNEDYSIRGYSNVHRKTGEYTYSSDAVLTVPSAIKLQKTDKGNFVFALNNISEKDYYTFFGAQGFIRYKFDNSEKIMYSTYFQTNLYNAALALLINEPLNKTAKAITDYCENERKEEYIKKNYTGRTRHIFTATEIKGFKVHNLENGLKVSELELDFYGNGDKTEIVHLTDAHLNYVNEYDFLQNDPAVMSTREHRIWCCEGQTVPQILRAMEYASFADKIVLTGDMMDYFSHGCYQLTDRLCFSNSEISIYYNDYPKVVATLGNHELMKQMEGKVASTTTESEHFSALQKFWPNDLSYHSEIVSNKCGKNPVKIILLDNSHAGYLNSEIPQRLSADIVDARIKGMPVLIFQHVPLFTGISDDFVGLFNPKLKYDMRYSACKAGARRKLDDEVYTTITENADIIKGVFCGHLHDQFYSEILGTGKSKNYTIPQYIVQSSCSGKGHAFKIFVK